MKPIKVKNTEWIGGRLVCMGRIIFGNAGSFSRLLDMYELRAKLRPIIISPIEEICRDKYLSLNNDSIYDSTNYSVENLACINNMRIRGYAYKILAMPENIPDQIIRDIVHENIGKKSNNAPVLLECQEVNSMTSGHVLSTWNEVKLTHEGFVNIVDNNPTTQVVREAMKAVAGEVKKPKCVRDGLVKEQAEGKETWDDIMEEFDKYWDSLDLPSHLREPEDYLNKKYKWLIENYNPPIKNNK